MQDLKIISTNTDWACDVIHGFIGHSVHTPGFPETSGIPAFTHEQMLECARICEVLGKRYSFDEFPHLLYNSEDRTWSEAYYTDASDVADVLEPVTIDGVELYFLGRYTDWAWGEYDPDWKAEWETA